MLKVVLRSAVEAMDLINGDPPVFPSIGGKRVAFITRQTIFHGSAVTGCTSGVYYDTVHHLDPRRESCMLGCIRTIGLLSLLILLSAPLATAQVASQAPSAEALAAAKELVLTIHLDQQLSAILPGIIKNLKPSIVQGRSEVDRQYDALAPFMLEGFKARMSELTDAAAIVYARNFSTEDLLALSAFYKTPSGQRLLQKLPTVTQEIMVIGGKFGQSVGEDMQKRMIEELRKKGVNL
jgi:uncharacterized protein